MRNIRIKEFYINSSRIKEGSKNGKIVRPIPKIKKKGWELDGKKN